MDQINDPTEALAEKKTAPCDFMEVTKLLVTVCDEFTTFRVG